MKGQLTVQREAEDRTILHFSLNIDYLSTRSQLAMTEAENLVTQGEDSNALQAARFCNYTALMLHKTFLDR